MRAKSWPLLPAVLWLLLAAAPARAESPGLAVLPFAGTAPAQAYFGRGFAEDLIRDLSRVPGLRVMARQSVRPYAGREVAPATVARELGVRYVLRGEVGLRDGRLVLRATLRDTGAGAGADLWTEERDADPDAVLALRHGLAVRVARSLGRGPGPPPVAKGRGAGFAAYDLLLRATALERRMTGADNLAARDLLRRAIDLAPGFAPAHARLAQVLDIAAGEGWGDDPAGDGERALTMAERAASLDPTLPHAFWVLGLVLTHLDRYDGAVPAMEAAVALAPGYADARAFLAQLYAYTGHAARGLAAIERARPLNPAGPFWYAHAHGLCLYLLGFNDLALAELRASVAQSPGMDFTRRLLVAVLGALGDRDEARWQLDELADLGFAVTLDEFARVTPIRDPATVAKYLADLRRAGVAE
ncbi:MAG: hypothetical protein H6907_10940 [Hyphomicrobiales bacterium]|nr:hypothetical protein [Hyphomicrobiales bacterium]